jgi:hypothetical protein
MHTWVLRPVALHGPDSTRAVEIVENCLLVALRPSAHSGRGTTAIRSKADLERTLPDWCC